MAAARRGVWIGGGVMAGTLERLRLKDNFLDRLADVIRRVRRLEESALKTTQDGRLRLEGLGVGVAAGSEGTIKTSDSILAGNDLRASSGVVAGSATLDVGAGQFLANIGDGTGYTFRADSDCGHGVTAAMAGTNNYLQVVEDSSTGGARVKAANGGVQALLLMGYATTTSTSRTSTAPVTIYGYKATTDAADADADMNVFAVRTRVAGANRTLLALDEDGDLHVDGSGTLTVFDNYESDVELARATTLTLAGLIDGRFGQMLRYGRADVERAGLAQWGVDDGGREQVMWNATRFIRLLADGMWQQEGKIREQGALLQQERESNRRLEARLAELERRVGGANG
jgi:hypothetical protein